MSTYELILGRRSIRRFQKKKVPEELLERCVNAGRLAPSGANLQPLEFMVVDKEDLLPKVFETLQWAAYLDWESGEGERPTAYIAILLNKEINPDASHEVGMAAENIILTALEEGVASCCLGSIDRDELRRILTIPEKFSIELVIALGYPAEESFVEEFTSPEYWQEGHTMHIPKKSLESVMHRNIYQSR